jgi:hypothetical protein
MEEREQNAAFDLGIVSTTTEKHLQKVYLI